MIRAGKKVGGWPRTHSKQKLKNVWRINAGQIQAKTLFYNIYTHTYTLLSNNWHGNIMLMSWRGSETNKQVTQEFILHSMSSRDKFIPAATKYMVVAMVA